MQVAPDGALAMTLPALCGGQLAKARFILDTGGGPLSSISQKTAAAAGWQPAGTTTRTYVAQAPQQRPVYSAVVEIAGQRIETQLVGEDAPEFPAGTGALGAGVLDKLDIAYQGGQFQLFPAGTLPVAPFAMTNGFMSLPGTVGVQHAGLILDSGSTGIGLISMQLAGGLAPVAFWEGPDGKAYPVFDAPVAAQGVSATMPLVALPLLNAAVANAGWMAQGTWVRLGASQTFSFGPGPGMGVSLWGAATGAALGILTTGVFIVSVVWAYKQARQWVKDGHL